MAQNKRKVVIQKITAFSPDFKLEFDCSGTDLYFYSTLDQRLDKQAAVVLIGNELDKLFLETIEGRYGRKGITIDVATISSSEEEGSSQEQSLEKYSVLETKLFNGTDILKRLLIVICEKKEKLLQKKTRDIFINSISLSTNSISIENLKFVSFGDCSSEFLLTEILECLNELHDKWVLCALDSSICSEDIRRAYVDQADFVSLLKEELISAGKGTIGSRLVIPYYSSTESSKERSSLQRTLKSIFRNENILTLEKYISKRMSEDGTLHRDGLCR